MNIKFLFCFFLFNSFLNYFVLSYIVIPFNTYKKEEENPYESFNITKFFQNNFESQIYAKMYIGIPKTFFPINLRMNIDGLTLGYLCDSYLKEESNYNINKSSTFYSDPNKKYYSRNRYYFIVQDSFTFFSDVETKNEVLLNDINFVYLPKEQNNKCDKIGGTLGLELIPYYSLKEDADFIKNLKKFEYINSYDFSFYFTSDNEGQLIIGEEPHIYFPKIFKENNLRKSYVSSDGYGYLAWRIEFNKIYFNINNIKYEVQEKKTAIFAIENNFIVGSKMYQKLIEENFFKKYLDNNICHYEETNYPKYSILICNKDSSFDINSFPTLYLYHEVFNYTFELNKNELFIEKNNQYIFLVFFWEVGLNYFTLGKIFLRKYLFTFNLDSKTIGFYNVKYEEEKEDNKGEEFKDNTKSNSLSTFFKIFGLIIVLIASIVGFFFVKKLYDKNRKKRVNEMSDDCEYESHDSNNINLEKNGDKKIYLEIPLKS